MPIDKGPVDLEAEVGAVAEMQVTVAQFRVLAEEAISQRVSLRPAVGLDPKTQRGVASTRWPCSSGEHYPVLLGEMTDKSSPFFTGFANLGQRVLGGSAKQFR